MIPEKGKAYHIEFTDQKYPEYTHYVGTGIHTGESETSGDATLYQMKINDPTTEDGFFEQQYIKQQINPHDGSTLDSFMLEEATEKINRLQVLLFETIEYIEAEKNLRNVFEVGRNERLDKEADTLIKDIKNEFTADEWDQAKKEMYKKYSKKDV